LFTKGVLTNDVFLVKELAYNADDIDLKKNNCFYVLVSV